VYACVCMKFRSACNSWVYVLCVCLCVFVYVCVELTVYVYECGVVCANTQCERVREETHLHAL